MAKKLISWKTKGMNRDASVSAFNPEFSFENRNIRLATNEGNTMMSWVTERGTKDMTLHIDVCPWAMSDYVDTITGSPIGTAVLNHKVVLFTVSGNNNLIYVLWKSNMENVDIEGKLLFSGSLGITLDNPLETLVSYESESIQKVYWTDGLNQPRVINIAADKGTLAKWNTRGNTSMFDFVPELRLKEEVKVSKIFGSGEFPAGVIQYAFTYYNKYGQESNIFHTSPLQYISYIDRGGSPDSKIANSFKIEVTSPDDDFDYLRIYSILRTSINATPLCKRIQDLEIKSDTETLTFIDDGLHGETVDPTELLYKGGEETVIQTMEQKDGTLFLGNIKTNRRHIDLQESFMIQNNFTKESPLVGSSIIESVLGYRHYVLASKKPLKYINTLSTQGNNDYEGAAGFKSREYYRLGIQLQYKTGKWSEPYWIGDVQQTETPVSYNNAITPLVGVPEFKYTWRGEGEFTDVFKELIDKGYRKVRPVFAVPSPSDRTILLQGVGCPTMYRKVSRFSDSKKSETSDLWTIGTKDGNLYAQSSWLFRCPNDYIHQSPYGDAANGGGYICYSGKLDSQFDVQFISNLTGDKYGEESQYLKAMSPFQRNTEVMGIYDDGHAFYVDTTIATVHSPDLQFDDYLANVDFNGCSMRLVGEVPLVNSYGDIDIQTSTPTIGSDAAGFIHKSIVTDGTAALISAPFYNDYIVDDIDVDKYGAYHTDNTPVSFPVYMWQKNGSLNNDVNRTNRSAELLKKKISNYRLGGETTYYKYDKSNASKYEYATDDFQLFNSDVLSMIKINGHTYMGNVESMFTPTTPSPHYFCGSPFDKEDVDFDTVDTDKFIALADPHDTNSTNGIWIWEKSATTYWGDNKFWSFWRSIISGTDIGDKTKGLCQWREPISMKYKSTPHLVVDITNEDGTFKLFNIFGRTRRDNVYVNNALPVVEVVKPYDSATFFGGTSDETLRSHTWIPCGPAVDIPDGIPNDGEINEIVLNFKWGDTYFQRFECLKTYPFTPEDKNQVVEIASFAVETRVNIDGRYDRNRAQTSNLNMTPQNFNLMNPVYSQMDNFFSYKILDDDTYKETSYPNTVTWTKTKQNGADVDLWTNITLANTLELDGDKGEITKLTRLNNQLLCFQDKGISQILYNENTQISTTEGVPIEIANSEKVQGKRYLSDTVGCSNKWSMAQTPIGIYFMDSNEKSIYMFNGQLNNISTSGGFNSWAKQNIPSASIKWNPNEFGNFVTYYDKANQDVLFVNKNMALAYSEKFNCFTSFYDYWKAPFFCTLDDIELWVIDVNSESRIYQHQAGDKYCKFFGLKCPFSMTLVANQEPQVDKIFTNLEFRACIDGEGTYDKKKDKFTPLTPFDNIEVWNEYQHGRLYLTLKNKDNKYTHGLTSGILDRKFRIWRCDIPRDNAPVLDSDAQMGIKRFKAKPLDRIRNPWAYIKLEKDVPIGEGLDKIEIHDIVATYFA